MQNASTYAPVVQNICVLLYMFVGADGERSRQRQRSATDAAHPLRVHIGPFGEPANSPQISMKTVRTARADVGIGPYNMLCNIVIGRVFRK